MKKIILGTLVLTTVGMGFGFAQAKKSDAYYDGYKYATQDYSKDKDYKPSQCDKEYKSKKKQL